jgi:hypothetical protein
MAGEWYVNSATVTTTNAVWYTTTTTCAATATVWASGNAYWVDATPYWNVGGYDYDTPLCVEEPAAAVARGDARARALELLREMLSDAERAEMETERVLTVESKSSKRRYRIRTDAERHGNIEEIDAQGRVVATLCCAPRGSIPVEDALLGQKLALEHDEDAFRKAANITPRRAA